MEGLHGFNENANGSYIFHLFTVWYYEEVLYLFTALQSKQG